MKKLMLSALVVGLAFGAVVPQRGGELRFALHGDPRTFDPLLVDDSSSQAIQYLTKGVLARFNRHTQAMEPELALSWKTAPDGRKITFHLRKNVRFSDGTPFTAADVAYTFKRMMDPALHSPIGDQFRTGTGPVETEAKAEYEISITFPAAVAGLERLLDQVPMLSSKSPLKDKAVLGPFVPGEYRSGSHFLLTRNPQYWKKDSHGEQLPYLDSIRLTIQQNRETELLRFRRGELDLIDSLDSKLFDQLAAESPQAARDLGPSLDSEFLWFNQAPHSPMPAHKKAWFQSAGFRRAISSAINRADLCRLAFNNHAVPAAGPVSPANQFWFNKELKPHSFDQEGARRLLEKEGFRKDSAGLKDAQGHLVEFSIITNAGNQARARMSSLIQQDLAALGIKVNLVPLDFPSLLERISRTADYEACLLGFVNIDLDPNAQMNVWLSSASNHPWNPKQAKPATPWEAEIDKLMTAQAATADAKKRKASYDRVQKIVWEQAPVVYLVHKNYLVAVSPRLSGADPRATPPQTYWNIEWISLPKAGLASNR